MLKKIFSSILLFGLINSAFALDLFGPKNYEDCLLRGMKGVSSDAAARAVYYACEKKFLSDNATISDNAKKHVEFDNKGRRVCRSYWDGATLKGMGKGAVAGGWQTIDVVYEPTQVLYIVTIPRAMYDFMEKQKGGLRQNFIEMLSKHKQAADAACGL